MMRRLIALALVIAWAATARAETFLPILPGASQEGGAVRVRVVEASAHQTTLDFEVLGLFLDEIALEEGTFATVSLGEGRVSSPGKPQVPFVSRAVAIPRDAVPIVEVLQDEVVLVEGVRVAPVQPKPKRCGPAEGPARFVCDRAIYDGREVWPADVLRVEEVGVMRDVRFARLRVNAVQYDPGRGGIRVHARVRVRVRHPGTRFFASQALSPTFEAAYRRTFVNYEPLRLREEAVPAIERILIFAPDALAAASQVFADFKRRQGFWAEVVPLSVAGSTNTAIKKYLQSQYNDPTTRPTFVVLVGDVQKMPTNHGIGGCASDFIYSQLEGNDLVSDVLVSRFSVKDEDDLALQVGKVIWYESQVGTDASWLSGAICISSSEGDGTSNDDYRSNIICGLQKDYGYFPVNKLYASNGANTVSKVSSALNEGRGWVTYLGHGSGTSWLSTVPEFSVSHVEQLKNASKLPFVVDISCDNGAFDQYDTCFAEAWMRASKDGQPTGAVAMYSASTPAYWDEPGEMAIGMTKAFLQEGLHRWGEVALAGRTYLAQVWGLTDTVQETFEQYILFGDASMLLRSRAPVELVVTGPSVLPVGEVFETFTVTRPDSTAVSRALVHVFREGEVDVAGYTDGQGNVTLALAPETPGELDVVVTAFDAVPWMGKVSVVITGCGIVKVKPGVIRCDQTLSVTLWDQDLNHDPAVQEQAAVTVTTTGGAFGVVSLTETAPDSSQFSGDVDPVAAGLQPAHGALLTARYDDADCEGSPAVAQASATWDCEAPAIFSIEVLDVTSSSARIRWKTSEAASGRVLLGPAGQAIAYGAPGFGLQHEVVLKDLAPATHYVYRVEATDAAGNVALTPTEGSFDTPACTPACEGKQCGPDGCGGSCGECGADQECNAKGQCFGGPGCETQWWPGCGGCKCEKCVCAMDPYCCWSAWDEMCVEECVNECGGCGWCQPSCEGKECGDDGCGGSCGSCPAGLSCVAGVCQCVPSCAGKACGPDGCGGTCGKCHFGQECVQGHCECVPSCEDMACGVDGCGNSCGTCPEGLVCHEGACVCVPDCGEKECGPDGCGGSCGECPSGWTCDAAGQCVPPCVPDCAGRECGEDGCGGSCGECPAGLACQEGQCVCVPDCGGRLCGDDGCGGSCGECPKGFACADGRCECVPVCDRRECGPDGCGGTCGTCPPGEVCGLDGVCRVRPDLGRADASSQDLPDAGGGPEHTPAPSGSQGCAAGSPGPEQWIWVVLLAAMLAILWFLHPRD